MYFHNTHVLALTLMLSVASSSYLHAQDSTRKELLKGTTGLAIAAALTYSLQHRVWYRLNEVKTYGSIALQMYSNKSRSADSHKTDRLQGLKGVAIWASQPNTGGQVLSELCRAVCLAYCLKLTAHYTYQKYKNALTKLIAR